MVRLTQADDTHGTQSLQNSLATHLEASHRTLAILCAKRADHLY